MNLLRRADALREFVTRAVDSAYSLGIDSIKVIHGLAFNTAAVLGKVDVWSYAGQKTFQLSNELVEAFQYTDIPLASCPSEFKYPFDTFLISAEIPMFRVETPIGVHEVFDILFVADIAVYNDRKSVIMTKEGETVKKIDWNKSLTAFYTTKDCQGFETMVLNMRDNMSFKETIGVPTIGVGMTPVSVEDAQNLVNIFYNTIMYINDPERSKEDTEILCSRKVKMGNGKESKTTKYIFLKPPKKYIPLNTESSGRKIDKRFIVRGHWRSQAYGEHFLLRKHIWIKPFYKGPELAEIVNKSYRVE